MICTLTFNPAIDYLVYLDAVKVGEIQRSTGEAIYFSGKGINVSKVMKTLGVETTALGFLAGFTGRAIADELLSCGIACDFCFLPEGNTRINVKLRHAPMDGATETDVNAQGPRIPEESLEELYGKIGALTEEDVLIISGSAPKTLPRDVYRTVLLKASERGARTVLDADGDLFRNGLGARPFLVKPNREELSALLSRPLPTDADILSAVSALRTMGARNVLVSLGAHGAVLARGEGCYLVDAPEVQVSSTVGAGDSSIAGFISAYLDGEDGEGMLKRAVAFGSAACMTFGTTAPTKESINELLSKM